MSLNITVVYGSVREGRQGIKAAKFIVKKLEERKHNVTLVDPLEYDLPLLRKKYVQYKKGESSVLDELHEIFQKSDAFVLVSAEYNHGVPPALKNMLDYFGPEFSFKPSAIVCYSGGPFGGVRAAMQWRMILPELGMISIPNTFPISMVQDFSDDGKPKDPVYNDRAKKFLDELEWYAEALKERKKKGLYGIY